MIRTEPYAYMAVPGEDRGSDPENIRRYISESEQAIFGAFLENGRLTAAASIHREKPAKRRHRAHIWGVYAAPDVRGRGYGRSVMRACIEQARSWPGVEVIGLSAAERSAAAIRLYESLGFVIWGVEPDGTRVAGQAITELHMQLKL